MAEAINRGVAEDRLLFERELAQSLESLPAPHLMLLLLSVLLVRRPRRLLAFLAVRSRQASTNDSSRDHSEAYWRRTQYLSTLQLPHVQSTAPSSSLRMHA